MNRVSMAVGFVLVTAAFLATARRLEAADGTWSFSAAPVASIHPDGDAALPYLSQPLGGVVPGLVFGAQRRLSEEVAIALELGSSLNVEDPQTGRFVFGSRCTMVPGCFDTAPSTHRDTIAGLLVTYRRGPFEMGAGPALAWSVTHQGDDEFVDPTHLDFALSAGIDAVLPVGKRWAIVPTARYHFVIRGDERMYAGLSRSVIRVGVGVRLTR